MFASGQPRLEIDTVATLLKYTKDNHSQRMQARDSEHLTRECMFISLKVHNLKICMLGTYCIVSLWTVSVFYLQVY